MWSCASTYHVTILNSFNTELQLKNTEFEIRNKLIKLLNELRGLEFVAILVVELKKTESVDDARRYSISKAETIDNESNIDDVFKSTYTKITSNLEKSFGKGSVWIIDSVLDHTIYISKYNPLAGRSYIKLTKKFDYPNKVWLIFKTWL